MEDVNYQVEFLHTNKYESFLQIDTMIFDGDGQAFPKFLMSVDILHADKHQCFLQVDFTLWTSKFPTG